MNDWAVIISVGALAVSILSAFVKSMEKNLSIREHEASRAAIERDIHRVESRLNQLERTRPTTGELEILAEALNKRIDTILKQ